MSHQETEHQIAEQEPPIFRTSPERLAKMILIVGGICVVGAILFFGMWDYWISSPSAASLALTGGVEVVSVAETGVIIPVTLSFIESSDFRTLAFNALPGDPNNNPEIRANIGDKIIFDVTNDGISFHAFGVTQAEEGFGGIVPGSDIASASNPMKGGDGGQSEFIPGEEGIYYYICTVPGHREQGMVGKIIVGNVSEESSSSETMQTAPEPKVTVTPTKVETKSMEPFTGTISVPSGSGVPGCDETNECYIPAEVTVSVGETVTWSNDDTAAHTVTSGIPGAPDGTFDSSLFMAGTTFDVTFDTAGEYDYFCMVHPWMTGKVQVG